MIRRVLKRPKILWRSIGNGPEWSPDDGETWYFTFRDYHAFEEMHGETLLVAGSEAPDDQEEREIFGETLDEPIPDALWAMIKSA